jgi:glutaryl-CoA dehydrogenase
VTSPTTDCYAVEDLLEPEEIAIRDRVRAFCSLTSTPATISTAPTMASPHPP